MIIRRLLVLTLSVSALTVLAGCDSSGTTAPTTVQTKQMTGGKSKHTFEAPPPVQPINK